MTMMVFLLIFLTLILFYGIILYNHLIALKNYVAKNWSNIDVLLKQRNSEIPKLIDTCKTYMSFEQTTFKQIVEARNATMHALAERDIPALGIAEASLQKSLTQLFALAEQYPELKTNQSFLQLGQRISDLENSIADRREFYNESVNTYNTRIQQFPDLIIANLLRFNPAALLKFGSLEIEDPKITDRFHDKV